MKIRRFYGKDMREALNQVKQELGGDAVIMSNKKVGDGIEIVAAYDKEPVASFDKKAGSKINDFGAIPRTAPGNASANNGKNVKPSASLSEIIGESGSDSLKALLEKQQQSLGNVAVEAEPAAMRKPSKNPKIQASTAQSAGYDNSNENVAALTDYKKPVTDDSMPAGAMNDIRQELKSLRDVLEFQVSGLLQQEKQRSHPLHAYLISRLVEMGVNHGLAEEVVSYAPENTDEREAWLFILKLLANKLRTGNDEILTKGGIVALVGSTGCGKTTTIAKLAAQYAQKHGTDKVAMVTIDSYRIAAYDQLATYGKIIGCPVKKAANAQELSDVLYQFRNKQLVLIDTAGFGQRDARLIKQLETLNSKSGVRIEKYLVVQANTQRQVLEKTFAAFQQDTMKGCIFTKLDECYSLGEVVSVAIQKRVPVSYLTDGQRVPEDLKIADAKYLVSAAAKLYKKYCLPHTTTERIKQSAVAV